jgi:hypothetical protein
MNTKTSLAIALAAGLLGGLLTRYIAPSPAFAQNQAPIAKEIRAQSFTLVDPSDRAVGIFTFEPVAQLVNGQIVHSERIVLRDSSGREIWSAGNTFRPLGER